MKTLSPDTDPKMERIHIEFMRKAPISRRLQMVASLIQTTRQLSWRGICERYPLETGDERLQRFLMLLYEDQEMTQKVIDLRAKKGIHTE